MEVKCPYSYNNKSFLEATGDNGFCLECTPDGTFALKKKHAYFYQVQLQMKLCSVTYCDFVVWREKELAVIRIGIDEDFLLETTEKATTFYKTGVLPELMGKWSTKAPTRSKEPLTESGVINFDTTNQNSEQDSVLQYCYCKMERDVEMIGCDADNCLIEWFHMECLKIHKAPKGKWYCPDCRKGKKKHIS